MVNQFKIVPLFKVNQLVRCCFSLSSSTSSDPEYAKEQFRPLYVTTKIPYGKIQLSLRQRKFKDET